MFLSTVKLWYLFAPLLFICFVFIFMSLLRRENDSWFPYSRTAMWMHYYIITSKKLLFYFLVVKQERVSEMAKMILFLFLQCVLSRNESNCREIFSNHFSIIVLKGARVLKGSRGLIIFLGAFPEQSLVSTGMLWDTS